MTKPKIVGRHKSLEVVYLPLTAITVAARNARTHSPEQIQQLTRSIQEFGFTSPILIDEDRIIIAGHGRAQAARAAGLTEAPTIALTGLSAAQKRALAIADNRLALSAGWDQDTLRLELGELGAEGFDVSLIGFSGEELAGILDANDGLTDPDDAPDVQGEAVSRVGDVWLLGRHRLLCGDCTDAATVKRVMGSAKPHLMVTDPPYGVDYDPSWRNRADRANGRPYGARAIGTVINDDRADWTEAYALFPGDVVYSWHPPGARSVEFYAAIERAGFLARMQIIWVKSNFPIGRGNYHVQHEPCWYAVRKGATARWSGDRKQTTVWEIPKPAKSETGHSTQKPVECMKRPIENNSRAGNTVYDPFVGSGTTIIAAEMTGRSAIAVEIAPQYVDVSVRRWQAFAGGTAMLDGDGRTFDEISAERLEMADAAD